jgi:hypothetical protein
MAASNAAWPVWICTRPERTLESDPCSVMSDPTEYRPSPRATLLVTMVWVATAAVLFWLGTILGPEDREAMDGFALLLFTLVPIRLFSWTMAVVFLGIGVSTARRGFLGRGSGSVGEESGGTHGNGG